MTQGSNKMCIYWKLTKRATLEDSCAYHSLPQPPLKARGLAALRYHELRLKLSAVNGSICGEVEKKPQMT